MVTELTPLPLAGELQVAAGRAVAINYSLSCNGVVRHVRSALWGDQPLEYLHGAGNLILGLERALEGRAIGDHFTVSVPPHEAYGDRDRRLQQRVAADLLGGMERLQPGMRLLASSEDGSRVESLLVTDLDPEDQSVVLDANHPLAGMTLQFDVSVVAIREATAEELQQGFLTGSVPADSTIVEIAGLRGAREAAERRTGQGA